MSLDLPTPELIDIDQLLAEAADYQATTKLGDLIDGPLDSQADAQRSLNPLIEDSLIGIKLKEY